MKLDLTVISVENGYIVMEGSNYGNPFPFTMKKWVAETPTDLATLIKQLADEQKHKEQK